MLTATLALWLVRLAGAYLALGLCFALPFAARWVNRIDAVAAHGTAGFRILVVPGAVLLWPLLAWRLFRRRAA